MFLLNGSTLSECLQGDPCQESLHVKNPPFQTERFCALTIYQSYDHTPIAWLQISFLPWVKCILYQIGTNREFCLIRKMLMKARFELQRKTNGGEKV